MQSNDDQDIEFADRETALETARVQADRWSGLLDRLA